MNISKGLQKGVPVIKGAAQYAFWAALCLGLITLIAITIANTFGIGGNSSDSRAQHPGESNSEYHQRLQAEDEELYKDCGFRPAC